MSGCIFTLLLLIACSSRYNILVQIFHNCMLHAISKLCFLLTFYGYITCIEIIPKDFGIIKNTLFMSIVKKWHLFTFRVMRKASSSPSYFKWKRSCSKLLRVVAINNSQFIGWIYGHISICSYNGLDAMGIKNGFPFH